MDSLELRTLIIAAVLAIATPAQAAPADDNDRGATSISESGAEHRNYDFKDKEGSEGASNAVGVYPSPDLNAATPALLALAALLFLLRRRSRTIT